MRLLLLTALLAAALLFDRASAAVDGNVRVSVGNSGSQLAGSSGSASSSSSLDASGEVVAFESVGTAADGDANGTSDIYVRLVADDRTELISSTPRATSGNNASTHPSITDDGRFVAFQSLATDLVASDGNNLPDIYVKDRADATMLRVSTAPDGGDANGASTAPAISPDGSTVAFCSSASNLVSGDDNGESDVFLFDIIQHSITRIAPDSDEPAPEGGCRRVAVSSGGQSVVFSYSVTNKEGGSVSQVYLHDRSTGSVKLISASGGAPGDGSSGLNGLAISADGDVVAFDSTATNLVGDDRNGLADVIVWTSATEGLSRVSANEAGEEGNGDSGTLGLALSGDGRWLAFSSAASNLLDGDVNRASDVFRLNLESRDLTLASADVGDLAPNGPSYSPDVSNDGSIVAFTSLATNVVTSDRNRQPDVFIRGGSFPEIASRRNDPPVTPTLDPAFAPVVTGNGGGGLPGWVLVAIAAGALAAALIAVWYATGRRPEA